jgi:hypothetical protein
MLVANANTPSDLYTRAETPADAFAAGMACRTPQGHTVRLTQVHMGETPYAVVYVINNPRIAGEMYLSELTPVVVPVAVGDEVVLHIGDRGLPVTANVLEIDGDWARVHLLSWNEIHWAHTAHVLSVKPRAARR